MHIMRHVLSKSSNNPCDKCSNYHLLKGCVRISLMEILFSFHTCLRTHAERMKFTSEIEDFAD
jgi:hypothetical protein